MNIPRSPRNARSAIAAGLALTVSSLSLAAIATAEPATQGRFELAQRGPSSEQQGQPDDKKENRRGKSEDKRQGSPDQGGERRQRAKDGDSGPSGGGRGPRARDGGDAGQQGGRGPRARDGGDAGPPGGGRGPRTRDNGDAGQQGGRGPRAGDGGDAGPPNGGRGPRTRDNGDAGQQGGRGPRSGDGGDAGPPGMERNQRSRNVQPQIEQRNPEATQPSTQPTTTPKPLVKDPVDTQDRSQDRTKDRRYRRDVENPTAPNTIQRPGTLDTAPSTLRNRDDTNGDRRNRGDRDTFRRGDNIDSGPATRETKSDYKRLRNERRREEKRDGYTNIDALKQSRKERRLQGGGVIIEEPDSRRIIRSGDRSFIIRDETRRMRRYGEVTDSRRRPGGGNITTIVRPGGIRIITETSPDGRLIRRYRRSRDGRDFILIDNRRTWRKWGAIGAGAVLATGLLLALDPPHYRLPRERYIVDYDDASYDDIYDTLMAPPIDAIEPRYTLDQVLFNYNLRERMRRIDLDSINFDTGSWDIDENQYDKLERLARAINRMLDRNADEMILIEGHTDAVGDPVSNRSLSDRRAEEVANILTEEFNVPPENLVIQGYGEEFLKVDTDGPSRVNRRVTVRRITPLLDRHNAKYRD